MTYQLMQISSRQIIPNVLCWLSLYRSGLVVGMTLLCSDSDESKIACRETIGLTDQLVPPTVDHHGLWCEQDVEASAQSVYQTACALMEEDPTTRWILNATGGNKPMSIGLHLLAQHPQVESVIYREFSTGWHHFRIANDSVPIDTPLVPGHFLYDALVRQQQTLEDVPLSGLIRAQFSSASTELHSVEGESAPNVNVAQWAERAVLHQKGWARALRELSGNATSDGFAFEFFVGACLKQAGVKQVACNVVAQGVNNEKLQETDIIAFHGNHMLFIDVKLSNETGKTERIRTAHATAHGYGGLSAKGVVLRPAWPDSATTVNYASATKVVLINRRQRAEFIDILLKQLGLLPKHQGTPAASASVILGRATAKQLDIGFQHRPVPAKRRLR